MAETKHTWEAMWNGSSANWAWQTDGVIRITDPITNKMITRFNPTENYGKVGAMGGAGALKQEKRDNEFHAIMASYGFEEPYPAMLAMLLRKVGEKQGDTGLKALEKFLEVLPQFREKEESKSMFDYLPAEHKKQYAMEVIRRVRECAGTFICPNCDTTFQGSEPKEMDMSDWEPEYE